MCERSEIYLDNISFAVIKDLKINETFTVKGHRKVVKKVPTSFKMSSFSHYLELKTAKRNITVMDINNSYAWIISNVFGILRILQSKIS